MRFSPPGGRLAGVFLRGIGPLGTVREARQVLRQCAAVRGVAVDIRPQEGGGTNQQPGRAPCEAWSCGRKSPSAATVKKASVSSSGS